MHCPPRNTMQRPPTAIGDRFGRLVVVAKGEKRGLIRYWDCVCDCGGRKSVNGGQLRTDRCRSCGCLERESRSKPTHGMHGTRTYVSWLAMRERCGNPRHHAWEDYGGRGIEVCARWDRFEFFLADMGERPAATELDRIDVNRGYEPGNCRWASRKTNTRNRRCTRFLEYRGERRSLGEWCEITGLAKSTVQNRIDRQGWSVDRALSTPGRGAA